MIRNTLYMSYNAPCTLYDEIIFSYHLSCTNIHFIIDEIMTSDLGEDTILSAHSLAMETAIRDSNTTCRQHSWLL